LIGWAELEALAGEHAVAARPFVRVGERVSGRRDAEVALRDRSQLESDDRVAKEIRRTSCKIGNPGVTDLEIRGSTVDARSAGTGSGFSDC
jgi:hypothetical protein